MSSESETEPTTAAGENGAEILRYHRPDPTVYPRLVPEVEPVGGRIRVVPEDFEVEEIPLYPFSGEGEHLFVTVIKTKRTTLDARDHLARSLGVRPEDVGFAGFKDRRAVAQQTFSVLGGDERRLQTLATPWLQVVSVTRHRNKLRTGHLAGNRFRIRIREVQAGAAERARLIIERLAEIGLANFYGPQRFGHHGDSYLVGQALLHRDPAAAVEALMGPKEGEEEDFRKLYRERRYEQALRVLPVARPSEAAVLHSLRRTPGNFRTAVRRIPRAMKRMYYSSYQAFLFNWCLRERMEWGPAAYGHFLPGDFAMLHRSGGCYFVTDIDEAEARGRAGEISPSGPIFGRKMTMAEGREGALERAVLAAENLRPQSFLSHVKGLRLDGARRPYRIPLPNVELEIDEESSSIVLGFTLPPGCYATILLEEVMGAGRTWTPPDEMGEDLEGDGNEENASE